VFPRSFTVSSLQTSVFLRFCPRSGPVTSSVSAPSFAQFDDFSVEIRRYLAEILPSSLSDRDFVFRSFFGCFGLPPRSESAVVHPSLWLQQILNFWLSFLFLPTLFQLPLSLSLSRLVLPLLPRLPPFSSMAFKVHLRCVCVSLLSFVDFLFFSFQISLMIAPCGPSYIILVQSSPLVL